FPGPFRRAAFRLAQRGGMQQPAQKVRSQWRGHVSISFGGTHESGGRHRCRGGPDERAKNCAAKSHIFLENGRIARGTETLAGGREHVPPGIEPRSEFVRSGSRTSSRGGVEKQTGRRVEAGAGPGRQTSGPPGPVLDAGATPAPDETATRSRSFPEPGFAA